MNASVIRKGAVLVSGVTLSVSLSLVLACRKTVLKGASTQSSEVLRVEVPPKQRDNEIAGDRIMVVCGWGGALPRHLRRIVELYQSKGFATVTVLPSMLAFLENGTCLGAGAELLLVLRDHLASLPAGVTPRIFIHAHSNTSTFYFYSVIRCMQFSVFKPISDAYCGTIYDSNPGHPGVRNIPAPKSFSIALNRHFANNKAGGPIVLNTNDTSSPDFVPTLPAKESAWAGTAFSKNNNPVSWLFASAIMSMVTTPIVIKKNAYFHPFWTPACFAVCYKEYAQSSLRMWAQKAKSLVVSHSTLTTRYNMLLSPHALPAMERLAVLIAESGERGINSANEAMRHLTTIHSFCEVQNFDIRHPMPAPELFVYSERDVLVSFSDTERYIYARVASPYEGRVPFVFAHRFKSTPHVGHFLKEPEEYSTVLDQFISFAESRAIVRKPFPSRWFGLDENFP